MVEQLHELDESEFCIVAIHVVNLSAEGLSHRVAAKVLHLYLVPLLDLLQHDIDSLYRIDSSFLAYQDRAVDASRQDVVVAIQDV